jgi:hypothetical protein
VAVPEPVLRREHFQDAEIRQFRPRPNPAPTRGERPKPRHVRDLSPVHEAVTTQLLVVSIAGLSAGAAAIHFAIVQSHLKELPVAGVFFLVLAIAQAAWAIAIPRYHTRQLLAWGATANLAVVALWLWVRIYGLPFGPEPWVPEPFGLTDTISAAFELTLALAATALLTNLRLPLRRLVVPASLLGVTVALGTWIALLHASMT